MTSVCPQCGYRRQPSDAAPDWQCPSCGIAYEKYLARADNGTLPTRVESARERPVRSINEVILICVGVSAVMLLLKEISGPVSVLHPALLVPLFFRACLLIQNGTTSPGHTS